MALENTKMHELSITQSMLDLVLAEAKKVDANKVGKINLVIGVMSGVIPDCLNFYFGYISKGTIAEGASLDVRQVPMTARCRECGNEFKTGMFEWSCPNCRGSLLEIISGEELSVESIEVE